MGKPLSFLSTPRENLVLPPRATREQRPPDRVLPTFASGSRPSENYNAIDFLCPPRSHSPDTTANGSVERSVPPRTDLSLRGFVASPYEEPFASAKRPTTCERPLRGVKGHIPTKRTFHGSSMILCPWAFLPSHSRRVGEALLTQRDAHSEPIPFLVLARQVIG